MTSFSEHNQTDGGEIWFALDEDRPLTSFARIKVEGWTSVRKIKTGEETMNLYGFLTTDPNDVATPIHRIDMSVILKTGGAQHHAPGRRQGSVAALPDSELIIVAKGKKGDGPREQN